MSSFINYFSDNIYYLRKLHNLTQREMARILGVSVGTLSRLEKGDDTVRVYGRIVLRICERFGVTAEELLVSRMW